MLKCQTIALTQQHHVTFESIKLQDHNGNEYWNARELARTIGYYEYRHFIPVINRAKEACINSGHKSVDHFEEILDMVKIGSGAIREVEDVRLSRYACYLILQNADQSKDVVAHGQTYFAIQTEDKLRCDQISGKNQANHVHYEVGQTVRRTINELGGVMPENLPTPDTSVKQLERQQLK